MGQARLDDPARGTVRVRLELDLPQDADDAFFSGLDPKEHPLKAQCRKPTISPPAAAGPVGYGRKHQLLGCCGPKFQASPITISTPNIPSVANKILLVVSPVR
jgi:hypothetical protein